ncbi:glyoxylate reductase [Pyricularia oryzae]|nr:glyoxylate reductase [Pyricularia oryzae]
MLPLISCLLALCPLAVLAGPAPELQKRSITCLKIGDNATATWKNAAGQTCTFTGVVGSNFGTNPAGTGDYSCNGRCGAGCSGSSLGNAYTQDCFSHDMCSFFNNASGGESANNPRTHRCAASLADYSVSELIPPSYFPKMAGESTGTRPKVLLLGTIDHADEAWSKLSAKADIVTPTSTDRASFLAECASGAFAGVVAAYRTFVSGRTTGRIDAELLAALPPTLRFICHNGAGYDQIDVAACTAAGVRVSNTPSAVDDATADAGIFLMLGALRNFGPGMQSCRNGEWIGKPAPALGHDPRGKVLGILGMGGIGRNMAKKAAVFGMKIRYYNRTRLSAELEADCGAEYVDFDTLLVTSDVLSLNLPLNPKTRHTISHAEFAKMKTGVVVVNTARGAVMDEAALVAALDSGRVASAGLDVYEEEPKVHPGLLANHRCLLVPHMGTYTEETQTKMEEVAISNVVAALEKGQLVTGVPEQSGLTF